MFISRHYPLLFNTLQGSQTRVIRAIDLTSSQSNRMRVYLDILEVSTAETSSIGTSLEYDALSYTWEGPKVAIEVIDEHGGHHEVQITESLATGLIRYREYAVSYDSKRLWADQLSIDQIHDIDKQRQIPMMRRIFGDARQVHVWLGTADKVSDLAIDAIHNFESRLPTTILNRQVSVVPEADKMRVRALICSLQVYGCNAKHIWSVIAKFCERRWFARSWVLQEVTSSGRSVLMHCGEKSMALETLIRMYCAVNHVLGVGETAIDRSLYQMCNSNLRTLNFFLMLRDRPVVPKLTLLDLRRLTLKSQATNPRDKIYAIMGMASDMTNTKSSIVAEYHRPVAQVYIHFALWHLVHHGNLDFLSEARPNPDVAARELPCWVPDWQETEENRGWLSLARRGPQAQGSSTPVYSASGSSTLSLEPLKWPSSSSIQLLVLNGTRIGKVKNIDANRFRKNDPLWNMPSRIVDDTSLRHIYERTLAADVYQEGDANSTFYPWRRGAFHHDKRLSDQPVNSTKDYFQTSRHKMSRRRLFFTTGEDLNIGSANILGSGPDTMQDGDELWVLRGGQMLYILRPHVLSEPVKLEHFDVGLHAGWRGFEVELHRGDTCYDFVGDAFALGLMDGEIFDYKFLNDTNWPKVHLMNPLVKSRPTVFRHDQLLEYHVAENIYSKTQMSQYRPPFPFTWQRESQALQTAPPFPFTNPLPQSQTTSTLQSQPPQMQSMAPYPFTNGTSQYSHNNAPQSRSLQQRQQQHRQQQQQQQRQQQAPYPSTETFD